MCVPGCQDKVLQRLSRRHFLKGLGVTAVGLAAASCSQADTSPQPTENQISFGQVVDLTHTLGTDFPTFGGTVNLELETVAQFETDGYNMLRWLLVEHTGTHMDAPIHFAAGQPSADLIPVGDLVLPLAVIDIRAKAADNADAQLTPDDITAWEEAHGPLPERACVAMYSGWEEKLGSDTFRNVDGEGVMHFPGFHAEAAQFLIEERNVLAIAVDTLSLDYGPSADFATHYTWLPSGRWGMENVANLGQLPPLGATIVAGSPKIAGATGGPSRVIALV